jgi:tellurite resistance protein
MSESPFDPAHADARAEVRAKLATAAEELRDAERIAASMKTDDLELASQVKSLGFDGDSARIFHLLPMIHVAWADGRIQRAERGRILRLLALRQISHESEAYRMVAALLEERPAEVWFEVSLDLLRRLVEARPWKAEALVEMCIGVAEAAGGFLGFGESISPEEREALAKISDALGEDAYNAFAERLGKI